MQVVLYNGHKMVVLSSGSIKLFLYIFARSSVNIWWIPVMYRKQNFCYSANRPSYDLCGNCDSSVHLVLVITMLRYKSLMRSTMSLVHARWELKSWDKSVL